MLHHNLPWPVLISVMHRVQPDHVFRTMMFLRMAHHAGTHRREVCARMIAHIHWRAEERQCRIERAITVRAKSSRRTVEHVLSPVGLVSHGVAIVLAC